MTPTALPRRPNYFDGQDLGTADFLAERGHLDGLRRLYNTQLHTWGIAQGLEVAAGDDLRSVTISAGMAIQKSGQEILLTEATSLATPGLGGQVVNLFILSQAVRADPSQASLASGFKRLDHAATPLFAAAGGNVDEQAVFLASIVLAASGEVSAIELLARRHCGFALGNLAFIGPQDQTTKATLALDAGGLTPHLSLQAAEVQVTGAFEIAGGMTLGSAPPRATLDVQSGRAVLLSLQSQAGGDLLTVNQAGQTSIGAITPTAQARLSVAGDISLEAGRSLLFDDDGTLESGSADHAILLNGATAPQVMSFNEAGRIDLYAGATDTSDLPTLTLTAAGNVGIGVEAPTNALVVDGSVQSQTGGYDFGDGVIQTTAAISTTVQIGAVIEWWSGNGAVPLPSEFVICDGRLINDPLSKLNGMRAPNLVNLYVLGTTDYGSIGETGGSASHSHQITSLPSHTHSIVHLHPKITQSTSDDQTEGDNDTVDSKCSNTDHTHTVDITLQDCPQLSSLANDTALTAFATNTASSLPSSMGLTMIMRIR